MRKRTIGYLLPGLVVLALLFVITGTANAASVRFDFLAKNYAGGGTDVTGYIVVDKSLIAPGNAACAWSAGGCAGVISDWQFSYAGSSYSFDFSHTNSLRTDAPNFASGKHFVSFDAAGMITSWQIAVHEASGQVGLGFKNDGFYSVFDPNATPNPKNLMRIINGVPSGTDFIDLNVTQTWTRLPEPGTLSLLASGLLVGCLASFRKRFQ